LLAGFAGLALLLAVVGLYGVLSQLVAQRTHEIGLRMALGAQKGQVLTLVLRQGLFLIGTGLMLGLAGAAALTRYLQGMLYGLTTLDPVTYVGASALLAAAATFASWVPARRATRVDPLMALRSD
jgi:putative ABC transport system permease protein